ncbi:AAA ATPase, partial [Conidiobolus coronatus NRRL 28638]
QIGGLRGHLDMMFNHLVFPFLDETKDDPIVPSNGFLFHGPPGTGKTLLARAVVEMCFPYNPTAFFYIKASDLLSKWVGQTEQMLRDLFRQAQIWSPSLILLDEIDGLAQDRSDNTSAKNKGILSSLLTLMDGLHSSSRVTVIGTTNHLSNLDPALRRPGRFDHELEFQLPDLEARLAIITLSTTNMAHPPEAEMLREVATRLSGYSGADI